METKETDIKRKRRTIAILSGITLLGLLLRVWGAGHGIADGLFTHPDEIPFAYEAIRFANGSISIPFTIPFWSYSLLWIYFHSLGVFLYSFLEGLLKYFFSIRESFINIPDVFTVILIGRVMVGIIGTMTVPVVYLIGKRLFDEKTGIISATIMAVISLHVAHSHYAYVDIPQTFFLTLSFYFMVKVSSGETKWNSLLSGAFLALAMAIKLSAAPGFISLILAHYLREKGIKGLIRSKHLYISISGLILVYIICTPYYLVNPAYLIGSNKDLFYELYVEYFTVWDGIKYLGKTFSDEIGLSFVLLFFLTLFIIVIKREWRVLFLLSFPITYLPFFLLTTQRDHREVVPVLPFFVILISYALTIIVGRLPFKKKGIIITAFSLIFILPSIWKSLNADYFFWQKDTRVLAAEWIRDNLPYNARIGIEGHTLYNTPIYHERYQINQDFSKRPLKELRKELDFIVLSSLIYNRVDPEQRRFYDSLKENAQLIKVFNTFEWQFFNIGVEIYRLARQGEALTSTVPRTYSEKGSFALSFGEGPYGKEPLSFWLNPDSKVNRVLITEKRLETIGVFIYNGSDRSVLRVRNTFNRKKIVLNPYEKKAIVFEPTRSFPFTKYIYNIAIKSRSGQGSFVNILTDPKRIANALLEIGEWEEAISILSKSGPLDKEGWSLLGLAYSIGGRHKDALDAFRKRLTPSARELLDGNGWEKAFEKFTNIDSAFLIDSLTVNYNVDQFQQLVGRKMGWMAHFDPRFDKPGFLLFGPYKKFPKGHFKAIFKIRVIGSGKSPAARIDVNNEDTILAERIIKDTKGKVEEFSLNFYNDEPDRPIEFRVNALGKRELWVEEIKVFPDLQNHYKRFFGMIHHYWGLSAGDSGLREEAVEHFKIAGLLGNNDTEGLYQMAKVYEKMGMEEEAIGTYKRVIEAIPNHIDSLLALKGLGPRESKGIEEKIKEITPLYERRHNFGNFIEFIGYSIGRKFESPSSPSPLRGEGDEGEVFKVHPGEELDISYFWRSLKRMRSNYSIFVHFRKAGAPVFQNDHSPSLQMTKWKVGSVVRDNYTVTVPPNATAGRYEMVIGLWDPTGSKERIKLKGKTDDELKFGSIEILGMPSSNYRKDK